MSNEAFMLAESELLHALGVLLVCSYESSVEIAKTTQLLSAEDELTYEAPHSPVDMFSSPPPPFQKEQLVYTIVPGQIRAAAEERDITPSHVYGIEWVASLGFTKDEEMDIEWSYYYQSVDLGVDEDESCDDAKGDPDNNSIWSCSDLDDDSELDMDDYEEDSYLAEYHHGRDEIWAHYIHFPPNVNAGDVDNGEDDNDEDMAVDNDA